MEILFQGDHMKRILQVFSLLIILVLCLGCTSCNKHTVAPPDDFFDFEFTINGVTYSIPENIKSFIDNGWSFPENFDKYDDIIKSGGLKSTYLSQGENWFSIEIFNSSEAELALKDCPIGRLTYDFSGDLKICTAGDFLLNDKTLDDVISQYGEPLSQADYGGYTEIIYDKDESTGIYDRYTFRFDKETSVIEYFDIINFY